MAHRPPDALWGVRRATVRRLALALDRAARERARRHADGTAVVLRALPDYDALFGVDFTPPAPPAEAN